MSRRPSGVPAFGRRLLILLLVALPASWSQVAAARAGGPFADLDAINVALEIGGPLDLQGNMAPELLVGDLARLNRFKSTLEKSVGERLESCGILWDQGAVDEVSIAVFGRREDLPQGPPQYVYMVRVEVLNTTLASRGTKAEPVALRQVIGLADDAGLERALVDTAVGIVGHELRNCGG